MSHNHFPKSLVGRQMKLLRYSVFNRLQLRPNTRIYNKKLNLSPRNACSRILLVQVLAHSLAFTTFTPTPEGWSFFSWYSDPNEC